ncbi:MAG: DUF222 domain-containing protein, partial [Solirubrobacterales bacterium]
MFVASDEAEVAPEPGSEPEFANGSGATGTNPAELPLEHLEHQISELAAHLHAGTARWLELVAEFDRREAYLGWGCTSCAAWLSLRCGISPRAARDQVRVARRMAELPQTTAAFRRGELSYSKVRALARIAEPDSEPQLLELALHATAAQLERIVTSTRGCLSREDAEAQHERRHLSLQWDDDGSLVLRGRLAAEEGALLIAALDQARDQLFARGSAEPPADAALASAEGAAGPDSAAATDRSGSA